MKTDIPPSCPFAGAPAPLLHPPGAWPPGPPSGLTGWSLLRHMSRDLLGAMVEWRQQYGGMVHLRIWPEHQIVVSEPQLVRELLITNHDALVRWERGINVMAQVHGHSVLTAEGEAWRAKRQAMQASYAPKTVQAYVPLVTAAAGAAFSSWPASAEDWPVEQAFTSLGMEVILQILFSSSADADAREAEKAVHTISVAANSEMYWPLSWPDWMPWKRSKRRAMRVLNGLIERHIQTRIAMTERPADVLSKLLALHQDDPEAWPLHAVRDECMTAFLAGHETTAATLTWWAWCMATNPAAQTAARQEAAAVLHGVAPTAEQLPALAFLTQTLQETLRLYPAAPALLLRRSVRPISLGGWQLPARTLFSIPVWCLQRDARWFPEPEAFRPERFGPAAPEIPRGAFMPLGTGPRVCLGQHLAMAEMTLIAAMFLQRFEVSVRDGTPAPEPMLNITLRPRSPLRLGLKGTMTTY